ncbi:MAG: hypothetical protein HYU27_03635 [Acidobacteria bacterium]|nr:hypothetical protein [Acidobacteriota bacterium]
MAAKYREINGFPIRHARRQGNTAAPLLLGAVRARGKPLVVFLTPTYFQGQSKPLFTVEASRPMHLATETALDLLEGRLVKDQEIFCKQHLEVCKDCAQDVGRWRQLVVGLRRSHLESASDQDLEGAAQVFPRRSDEDGSTVRSVLARVVFDSFLQPALAGARGAGASRQLVMSVEEFDIHLKIWGEQGRQEMLGQLLPRNSPGFCQSARFHILRNGEKLDSTSSGETGEFHFSDLPEGDLSLQIDLPNLTVIGALNVKEVGG